MNTPMNNPIEQDEQLTALDARLQQAMPVEAPADLAQRIHDATADKLLTRHDTAESSDPVLARIGLVGVLQRLAVAAAVVLAVGVSWYLAQRTDVEVSGDVRMVFDVFDDQDALPVDDALGGQIASLSAEIDHLAAGLDVDWSESAFDDEDTWSPETETF